MFVTGPGRVDDQEVLHHADVLVRQDVTVVDGLTGPLLESHANDHGLSHPYRHSVLYGARGYHHAVDRDHLERIDVNVERMAFGAAMMARADDQVPLLRLVQVDDGRHFLLGVDRVVDEVVAANDRVDECRRVAGELDHPDTLDLRSLDQGVSPRGDRELVRQGHVLRRARNLDLCDDLFRALEELLLLSKLADAEYAGCCTRLHEEISALPNNE